MQTATLLFAFWLTLPGLSSAYSPTRTPLSCSDLTAVSCSAKGLRQCCVAGGDCCPDGSCCGVGQTCLSSGSGSYQCCNTSNECPKTASSSASACAPGSTPFRAQTPCSPASGSPWYCDFGQSCNLAVHGGCIGVASGGGCGSSGGSSGSSSGSSNSGSSSSSSRGSSGGSGSSTTSSSSSSGGNGGSASSSSSRNGAPGRQQPLGFAGSGEMNAVALLAMYLVV